MNRLPKVTCVLCGNVCNIKARRDIKPNGNYCSAECFNKRPKLSVDEKKSRMRLWARKYHQRQEVIGRRRKYYREYHRTSPARLSKIKKKLAQQILRDLNKRKLRDARLKGRMFVCKHCREEFVSAYGSRSRVYCSRYCQSLGATKNSKKRKTKGIPRHIFDKMRADCDFTCKMCNKKEPFTDQYWPLLVQDHIIPVSKGGKKRSPSNVQPLCWNCNGKKSDSLSEC